jgi:predicted permease
MTNWIERILRRGRRAQEIHDEIESHLDMRADWNRAAGMPSPQARLDARRKFGNATLIEEDVRAVHRAPWLAAIGQDLRYSLRSFRRTPVFTLTAVVTVALGIGASTAVFSVVDRILFRPLPYPEANRLVSVGMLSSADTNEFLMAPSYLRFRDRQTPFSSMASFGFTSACDLTEANPARLRCARVDSAFLPTFGIVPLAGRNFTVAEDRPNAPAVALLSFGFWMDRFAGDPGVIGRSIPIDQQPTTIIGVLPRGFELFNLSPIDLLMPEALLPNQSMRAVRAFARLKPGVSVGQARAALAPLFLEESQYLPPEYRNGGLSLAVRSLRDRQIAPVRTASWALLAAVLLVLLMACANVANLLLARAASRRRELAVRYALGAGRARLVRLALTESLLLATTGAAGGCALAWALLRWFIAIAPNGITRLEQATLDLRVLAFTVAVSVVAGILFGLAPALERPDAEAFSGRSITSFRGWLRPMLIAAQIAASLVLLTGAGLLLGTLWRMEHVPLGINPDHVVTARFVLSKTYPQARILAFYEGLESRLNRLCCGADPQVNAGAHGSASAAAIGDSVPPIGGTGATPFSALRVEGRPGLAEAMRGGVSWRYVTPRYFPALGIPILRGRTFNEQDREPAAAAIIVNQALAQRLFLGQDPIGRRMFPTAKGQWHTVVGLVGDVRGRGLSLPAEPEYYVVRKHAPDEIFGDGSGVRSASAIVRSASAPEAVAAAIRSQIAELDPTLPVQVETMSQRVRGLTEGPRFNAMLLAGFGAAGLLLAAIGIYGVIAFLVSQRTREVGVRMALGATPAAVIRLFVKHAARWTAAGLCVGLAGSIAATRLLTSMLFGTGGRDWWSFVASAAMLSVVALAAAWLPARRAARIDPVRTLRDE